MFAQLTITIPVWLDFIFACPLLAYRLLRYGYTFRRIYLGEGKWTILDSIDYYRLCNYKWYVSGNGNKFYARRNVVTGQGRTKMLSMHREIMEFPKGKLVDHRNRDTLDNRRENLRIATHSQNAYNVRVDKTRTSSKYVGVNFRKKSRKWTSYIRINHKKTWLGSFENEIDAARAYDKVAKKYHGEFARLNFSEESERDRALFTRIGKRWEGLKGLVRKAGGG